MSPKSGSEIVPSGRDRRVDRQVRVVPDVDSQRRRTAPARTPVYADRARWRSRSRVGECAQPLRGAAAPRARRAERQEASARHVHSDIMAARRPLDVRFSPLSPRCSTYVYWRPHEIFELSSSPHHQRLRWALVGFTYLLDLRDGHGAAARLAPPRPADRLHVLVPHHDPGEGARAPGRAARPEAGDLLPGSFLRLGGAAEPAGLEAAGRLLLLLHRRPRARSAFSRGCRPPAVILRSDFVGWPRTSPPVRRPRLHGDGPSATRGASGRRISVASTRGGSARSSNRRTRSLPRDSRGSERAGLGAQHGAAVRASRSTSRSARGRGSVCSGGDIAVTGACVVMTAVARRAAQHAGGARCLLHPALRRARGRRRAPRGAASPAVRRPLGRGRRVVVGRAARVLVRGALDVAREPAPRRRPGTVHRAPLLDRPQLVHADAGRARAPRASSSGRRRSTRVQDHHPRADRSRGRPEAARRARGRWHSWRRWSVWSCRRSFFVAYHPILWIFLGMVGALYTSGAAARARLAGHGSACAIWRFVGASTSVVVRHRPSTFVSKGSGRRLTR